MGEYLKPPASSADPYAHMRVDRPTEPWQMEKLKLESLRGLMTVNEIREQHLSLPGLPGGEKMAQLAQPGFGKNGESQGDEQSDEQSES